MCSNKLFLSMFLKEISYRNSSVAPLIYVTLQAFYLRFRILILPYQVQSTSIKTIDMDTSTLSSDLIISIWLFATSLGFSGLILMATNIFESEWSFYKNFSAFFFPFFWLPSTLLLILNLHLPYTTAAWSSFFGS